MMGYDQLSRGGKVRRGTFYPQEVTHSRGTFPPLISIIAMKWLWSMVFQDFDGVAVEDGDDWSGKVRSQRTYYQRNDQSES
jgi:hypothetical protein